MLRKFLTASAVVLLLAGTSFGQLIVDFDLGPLGTSTTNVVGDTTGFGSECDYFSTTNAALFWGDEVVYEFTVAADFAEINIMSNALTDDPDFYILDSTDVEDDGNGKLVATGSLANFFLDAGPPELGVAITVPAGTYYLVAAAYNGGAQSGIQATYDIDLIVTEVVVEPPSDPIDLGMIADANTPFNIDTNGSVFDTELALYDSDGVLLAENDDIDGAANRQSELIIGGLEAGTYYVVMGEFNMIHGFGFDVTTTGTAGGDYTLTYNGTSMSDVLAGGGIQWFVFTVGSSGVVDVTPDSLDVTVGIIANGSGLNELLTSDNVDLSLFRNPSLVSSRTEFIATGTSPSATPTTFDVTLEGSVFARRPVTQTVAMFDYDAAAFEIVSTETARQFSDLTVTASGTGDLSRFVGPGNEIQVRVRYQGSVNRLTFASNTDHFFWTIQ